LAVCFEKLGKTASAWVNFTELRATARHAGQEKRAAFAKERADALAAKLSKLKIDVAEEVEGLTITLDDESVVAQTWGQPLPIDPGEHQLKATAPGKKTWSEKVTVGAEADDVSITVPALSDAPESDEPSDAAAKPLSTTGTGGGDEGADDGNLQWLLGWTALGVGVAGAGAGVALRVLALQKDKESKDYCLPDDPSQCTQEGADIRNQAQAMEIGSIIAWAAGGALAVTGVVLVLTAPSSDDAAEAANATRVEWMVGGGPGVGTATMRVRW
jgi:hypothetical protein